MGCTLHWPRRSSPEWTGPARRWTAARRVTCSTGGSQSAGTRASSPDGVCTGLPPPSDGQGATGWEVGVGGEVDHLLDRVAAWRGRAGAPAGAADAERVPAEPDPDPPGPRPHRDSPGRGIL